jgi:hypothetical protein
MISKDDVNGELISILYEKILAYNKAFGTRMGILKKITKALGHYSWRSCQDPNRNTSQIGTSFEHFSAQLPA